MVAPEDVAIISNEGFGEEFESLRVAIGVGTKRARGRRERDARVPSGDKFGIFVEVLAGSVKKEGVEGVAKFVNHDMFVVFDAHSIGLHEDVDGGETTYEVSNASRAYIVANAIIGRTGHKAHFAIKQFKSRDVVEGIGEIVDIVTINAGIDARFDFDGVIIVISGVEVDATFGNIIEGVT